MLVFQHTGCVKPLAPELNPWHNLQNPRFNLHDLIFFHAERPPPPHRAIQEWP